MKKLFFIALLLISAMSSYAQELTYTWSDDLSLSSDWTATYFPLDKVQIADQLGVSTDDLTSATTVIYSVKENGTQVAPNSSYAGADGNNGDWHNAAGYSLGGWSGTPSFYHVVNYTDFTIGIGQNPNAGLHIGNTFHFQLIVTYTPTAASVTLDITYKIVNTDGDNIADRLSDVEASYTASWNYLYAIYDGTKGFGELANGKTWGSYSDNRPSEQWLRYGWNKDVTASQVNVYFWSDTETPGGGVAVPESWKIQYYDVDASAWMDVTLIDGQEYTCKRQAVNSVQFQPVTTRQLRLVMQAQTNGSTYSALGVTEWEVIGEIEEQDIVYGDYPITNVDFSKVHLTDKFWKARMEQNQTVTIPIALEQCEKNNRMLNFEKAAAILRGENIGYFDTEYTFDDTDIYKILEGMAYSIQTNYSQEMDDKMDELIALVGSAQEPDGYLYTPRTAGKPGAMHSWVGTNRWEKDPDLSHELYNCGHLYEAAYAHYISTGKRTLLDIAIKNADLLVNDFLVGGLTYEPGHQIVEMGLVKMYRATGN